MDKDYNLMFSLQDHETLFPEQFESTFIFDGMNKIDINGKLVLTDFRSLFMDREEKVRFDIPVGYIHRCESSTEQNNKVVTCFVQIITKFNLSLKIKSNDFSIGKGVDFINKLIGTDHVYAQRLGSIKKYENKLCYKQVLHDDYPIKDSELYDNHNWVYLPLYPQSFRVPRPFIGKRSPVERMIVLSFSNQSKEQNGLWRSGPGRPDPQEQQWIPKAKTKDHLVIQIKNRSLGSVKSLASRCIEMDNPFQLRESFSKLYSSTYYQGESKNWLSGLNSCRWFQQLQIIISETLFVMQKLLSDFNVTILSEWDIRGTQIAALVQILCKPEYRTFEGFAILVEKQFTNFGNWFNPSSKKQKYEDKGIGFLQFLDCVFQLISFYPLSFEFNEDFLTFIAINIYSKKFGNFLYMTKCINESERWKKEKMLSIWSQIDKEKYKNAFYVDKNKCEIFQLRKHIQMKNFKLWSSFFLRNLFSYSTVEECNSVRKQYRAINERHCQTQKETENYRNEICHQHKIISQLKNEIRGMKEG